MKHKPATATRTFVPVHLDFYQAAAYQHVATTVEPDGSLVAWFGDGSSKPSVYATLEDMLAAGERDFRDRMREEG